MPYVDYFNFGAEDDPAYRAKVLRTKLLEPLGLTLTGPEKLPGPDAAESPAEIERKRQEAADRLIRHDVLFGVSLGCTIGDEYKITKPSFTAGDEGAP